MIPVIGLILIALLWYIKQDVLSECVYLWAMPCVLFCGMSFSGTLRTSTSVYKAVIANPVIEFIGIISLVALASVDEHEVLATYYITILPGLVLPTVLVSYR